MKKLLQKDNLLFFVVAFLFLALTGIFIVTENLLLLVFPYALAIIWLAIKAHDKLIMFIVFLVPLSVPLSEYVKGMPIDMFIPTEPLLAGMLLLFILLLPTKKFINKELLYHPVSISIIILMAWMLLTTITSSMPLVSIKFFVMRLWFIIAFYYLMVLILQKKKNFERLVWLYAIPMVIVIVYALTRHFTYGIFEKKIAHWASNPFFKDHTIYGAALAFYIPFLVTFAFRKGQGLLTKVGTISILTIFTIALITSYSRAAWLSVVGATLVFLVIKFRVKWQILASLGLVTLIVIAFSWSRLYIQLEQNRQDSSVENIGDHVQSMTNISSDASNLERINRWKSAFRMFSEKPLLGFGPGTYMFQYAPYQMSYEKTIISTNAGDMGNAHSEYFGPLAEQGFLGMLSFLGLVITITVVTIKLYYRLKDPLLKTYVMGAFLGLVTYFLHGALNNFLDTDKASVPFWGFTAMIVAIDLYEKKLEQQ